MNSKSTASGSGPCGHSHAWGNGHSDSGGPGRHVSWQDPPREHWWYLP